MRPVASTPARETRRSPWGTALRAAASVAIVVFVLRHVPVGDLVDRFRHFSVTDVALLVVFGNLLTATNTVRWWRLLRRLDERVAFTAVARDVLVGALFNTFLPTSFGGDVIRALRTGRRLEAGHHAWSSSLFERIVGMLTLAIAAAIGVLFLVGDALPGRARLVVVVASLAFSVALFFASAPLRAVVHVLERRLPARFIADVRGVVSDLEGPLSKAPPRLETFGWSVLAYLFNVAYVVASTRALGGGGHTMAVIVGLPIVSILSLAPVSLGGHGLREGLFVVVLGALGVPKEVALGIGLLGLASNVFFAVAGAAVSIVDPTPASAERA